MIFTDLLDGQSILLDANIFVYYYSGDSLFGLPCKELIERIGRRQIVGITTTHIVCDVAHRLMTLEAASRFGWPMKGIAYRLKRQPSEVQQLVRFRQAIDNLFQLGIQVLTIPPSMIATAATISQQTGLLTNDALVVAVMREQGLANLASHDADFDRVAGVLRFGPA
jgi:predicted nucleic acid-binding protein